MAFRVQPLPILFFDQTLAILERAAIQREIPGGVFGVYSQTRPEGFWGAAVGHTVYPSDASSAVSLATRYDLASLTKVIGTATVFAALVERGWLRWDTPLRALLPTAPRGLTLSHLASHTAGYAAWEPLWQEMLSELGSNSAERLARTPISERQEWMRNRVLRAQPEVAAGSRVLYSDLSFLLLGFALEAAAGARLDRLFESFVFRPMALPFAEVRYARTRVDQARDARYAATEVAAWRGGLLQGQVHDENAWSMGGFGGHAGIFGTLEDVLRFARAWMNGFFSTPIRDEAWRPVTSPALCARTRGWDSPSGELPSSGRYFSPRSVGHLGFTGTSLWIDPDAGIAVAFLSNRVHPTRENTAIRQLRPRLHDAFREDWLRFQQSVSI